MPDDDAPLVVSGTQRPTVYDELLQAFTDAVNCALRTGRLSPICADFDVALICAVGDIARAARDGSRTGQLVQQACAAFGHYAVQQNDFEDGPPELSKLVERAHRVVADRSDSA